MPRFTDQLIKSYKCPPTQPYKRYADRGLVIQINKDGSKTWHCRYSFLKEEKDKTKRVERLMHIGDYPTMTLAQGRKKVEGLKEDVKKGGDPLTEYKEARTQRATAATIKDVTDAYLAARVDKKSLNLDKEYIDNVILPEWEKGKKLIASITKRDIVDLITSIKDTPARSNRLLSVIKAIFTYATDTADPPYLEDSPASKIKKVGKENKPRTRNLNVAEIKYLWNKLTETESNLVMSHEIKRTLMLTLLTAQRPGEVIGMHSREFSQDEMGGWWWTIPEERVKNERIQRIYLTPLAQSLIGNKKGYIFESDKGGKPMKQTAMSHAVDRNLTGSFDWQRAKKASTKVKLKEKKGIPLLEMEDWTPHDLRRTAATMMKRVSYDEKDIDMILNHKRPEDKMVSVYVVDEKDIFVKSMLEAWAELIEQIASGEVTGADIARAEEERALAKKPNFAAIKERWSQAANVQDNQKGR